MRIEPDPNAASQAERPLWLILPGLAMLLIALLPFAYLYSMAVGYIRPLTFDDLLQTYIHDRRIYISDLARVESVISGKTFENVTFIGPAVVAFLDRTVVHSPYFVMAGPIDAYLLEVPDRTLMVGVIGFQDSTFRNCQFERIQIVGEKKIIDQLKAEAAQQGVF
jgi:hypothetical protein